MNQLIKMMNKKVSKDKKVKIKPGIKNKAKVPTKKTKLNDDGSITYEDEKLLEGIDEQSDDGTDVEEISSEGDDIDPSEIAAFINKLGVAKHRPSDKGIDTSEDESDLTSEDEGDENGNVQENISKDKKPESMNKSSDESKKNSTKGQPKKIKDQDAASSTLKYLQTYKSRKYLLMKEGEMWREEKTEPAEVCGEAQVVAEAEKLAQRLLEDEVALYTKQRETKQRSDNHWLKTVMASGTLTDKMAALTLLVQESPLHNLAGLDTLAAMAGKKGRREAMMAVDTLRDLYLTGLLPDDRKLRPFNQHSFLTLAKDIDQRDKQLLMWQYEAQLKLKYLQFIKTLGEMSFDTLLATKEKAIATIFRLLSSKPEQEHTLLPMLVNKLGDPAIKSKTMYLLTKLVEEHPNMATVIVREVKHLMHRPNVSARAQYYSICFLSQLRLSTKTGDLATELITIYFFFFQTYLQKGQVDNKMMSALLSGVNRAYVYAKGDKQELQQQVDAVYKILPQVAFHTGVQALTLLLQVTEQGANASDRYYMNLYRKLGDPELRNSTKHGIFMNLIFKSLKRDLVDRRIKAFIKRLLQVYSPLAPQVVCAVLIILSQILKEKPGLIDFKNIAKGDWDDDDEEERFVDLPDPDEQPEKAKEDMEGDTEKTDKEKAEGSVNDPSKEASGSAEGPVVGAVHSSWVHRRNTFGGGKTSSYDPLSRNPLYCRAESDLVWELTQLTQHYHPSVRLYAGNILAGDPINYDGDPLKDFTLIRFLDKFVYKNPKKQEDSSTNLGKHLQGSRRAASVGSSSSSIPVNSEQFLSLGEAEVPEGDRFFHRYFAERAKRKKDDDIESDDGSVDDDEFDRFLSGIDTEADHDGDDDFDLDFARDKSKSKGQLKGQEDEPPSEDDDEEEEMDDDELDLTDDELADEFAQEMGDIQGGSDSETGSLDSDAPDFEEDDGADVQSFGSEVSESDDEDDELQAMMKQGTKRKQKESNMELPKKQKRNKRDTQSLFASADEFAHLLEEDIEGGKVSLGGADDVHNKDKSGLKQLQWEADRERGWNKKNYRGKGNKGQRSSFKKKGNDGRAGLKNVPINLKKGGKASKKGKPKPSRGKSR